MTSRRGGGRQGGFSRDPWSRRERGHPRLRNRRKLWNRLPELPMNRTPVAASRQSAAGCCSRELRRSAETPRRQGSWPQCVCKSERGYLPPHVIVLFRLGFQVRAVIKADGRNSDCPSRLVGTEQEERIVVPTLRRMKLKYLSLNDRLYRYICACRANANDPVLDALRRETETLGDISRMQISREQGGFMTLLAAAIRAASAIEVGTFTGYSSICIARGLSADGRLLCLDASEEWTAIAR